MKLKQRGFTLIELFIAIVFVLIVVAILFQVVMGVSGSNSGNREYSWGLNGMTEVRCIGGYKFIVNQDGSVRQVMDEFAKGVKCE